MSILRRVRTEELKAIRRKFGDRGGRCHFRDHALRPREDGMPPIHAERFTAFTASPLAS